MPKRTRRQKPAKHIIPTRKKAMRVLIIGGGFCGTELAKKLDKHKDLDITLFDHKNYFEYVPSVHKLMFEPEYHKKIIIPFKKIFKNTKIITQPVRSVTPKAIKTSKRTYPFDILVITTGIDYPIFLENKKDVYVLKTGEDGKKIYKALKNAKDVLIIGGGLIGTEVAAEIAEKSPDKKLTVVHSQDRLLERNPLSASNYTKKFLEKRGTELIFGERVIKHEKDSYTTNKDRRLRADIGIWCAGVKPDTSFMKDFPEIAFTERKALNVNKHMQLEGFPNIFVGGDISGVVEEKTAQNAERHAKIIAQNILRQKAGEKLLPYAPHSGPLVISLGDKHAIMSYKGWTWNGIIPGIMKWIIEYWIMFKFRYL